ncbi:hypothetical protein K378_01434 [Streptomyces sp. Amel2xB2]|uniref:hypothetical protein n=1 Tax=Streptomyces sp. Amel2xB2 TaxID=1305829 RepID=UPI000DBAAD48|nr:hypothetical protein [Streptomyces sp. Amel2xB2]RAJ70269.1 hypothetical protein K378_01434 [Streptomyces sp. Amel2xB2]
MVNGPRTYRKTDPADRAARAAVVFDLRIAGKSYRQIDTLSQDPNGPTNGRRISTTTAKELLYEEVARRIDPRVETWRAVEAERLEGSLQRLDLLAEKAWVILDTDHVTVSQGRTFENIADPGPALQAIDRLIKIEEQRRKISESLRKLFGVDAPQQIEATITEMTPQDVELQELLNEAKAKMEAQQARLLGNGGESA